MVEEEYHNESDKTMDKKRYFVYSQDSTKSLIFSMCSMANHAEEK